MHTCVYVFRGFRGKQLNREVICCCFYVAFPSTPAMFGSSKQLAFLPTLFFPRFFGFLCLFLAENTAFLKKEERIYCFKLLCGPGRDSREREMQNLSGCARRKLLSLEISSSCSLLGDIVYALPGTGPEGFIRPASKLILCWDQSLNCSYCLFHSARAPT